jgi:RNA polymerase-binding transcription factor DksA
MFNRSGIGKAEERAWREELREIETRWFAFLEKLETKMEELCSAALPELRALRRDPESYRVYDKMLSGVSGQLDNIRKKAFDTHDEKIICTWYRFKETVKMTDSLYDTGYAFRQKCTDRHNEFEEIHLGWHELLQGTRKENLEEAYERILKIFNDAKGKFTCKQCGAPIPLEKMYVISVHLACPACSTQNTFDPGSDVRGLSFIARDLAEKRVAHLYEAYQNGGRTPELYRNYARARCDELNRMLPDFKEHHERRYLIETQGEDNG